MIVTADTLGIIAGTRATANAASVVAGLKRAAAGVGLTRPHRLAHYLAQLAHESGRWRYDRELWGPTAAQRRYDTRTDLGNTAERDGDGHLYRGRGPIQLTGRANYAAFAAWAQALDPDAPDFVALPDAVNSDPWEGLVAIWFWDANRINAAADRGDVEAVTRIINGGTNGLDDRLALFTRAGLALLGYGPAAVSAFQRAHRLKPDGIAGPLTRAALHRALLAAQPIEFA